MRTEAECRAAFASRRWPRRFRCPTCTATGLGDVDGYRCRKCGFVQTLTDGTIIEGSRLPLTTWIRAAWLFASSPNGITAVQLRRQLGLGSYETAWRMLRRFRELLASRRQVLRGTIELGLANLDSVPNRHGFRTLTVGTGQGRRRRSAAPKHCL